MSRRLLVLCAPAALASTSGCAYLLRYGYSENHHTRGSVVLWQVDLETTDFESVRRAILQALVRGGVHAVGSGGDTLGEVKWEIPAHGLWAARQCQFNLDSHVSLDGHSMTHVSLYGRFIEGNGIVDDSAAVTTDARERFDALVDAVKSSLGQWPLSNESAKVF
jgi:hypothetical protein